MLIFNEQRTGSMRPNCPPTAIFSPSRSYLQKIKITDNIDLFSFHRSLNKKYTRHHAENSTVKAKILKYYFTESQ